MKTLRRFILYTLLFAIVLVAGLVSSAWIFKDRIINKFIEEANKSLNTPITIGKIDVSSFRNFPNFSIVFRNVYIEGSLPGKDTLLVARMISFKLNPVDVWNGDYDVRGLQVDGSLTKLRVNEIGKTNYNILKESSDTTQTISFHLDNVKLTDAVVFYDDDEANLYHEFSGDELEASITITGSLYKIIASGDVTSKQVGVSGQLYLEEKTFLAEADVDYDDETKLVTINPSTLQLADALFDVTGTYVFKDKNLVDVVVEGRNTDIQTVLALLPESFRGRFEEYQSDGEVYFTVKTQGEISRTRDPLFSVAFGCTNANFFHPKFNSRISNANLEGSFATPSFSSLKDAEIFLKNLKGELNGHAFEANFSLRDFEHPFLTLDFKGDIDAASLSQFYEIPSVNSLSGMINADVSFSGNIDDLRRRETAQLVKANGMLELHDLNISAGKKKVAITGLNGILQFNNNDLALSNTSGHLGKSQFLLNGVFKNSITFLLFEGQPIGIEADLKSSYIDLDELFDIAFSETQSDAYTFSISPNLHVNFNCDIASLHYKKFKPKQIKGNLLIKNQMAVSRDLTLHAMGGQLGLNGIVDAQNPRAIDVVSTFKLQGVYIDSLFYVFENFKQDFVQDRHLKGQADAEITTEMVLNEQLALQQETLVADISAIIRNGELNNFEPMKALNRYLDDEGLARLRFGELRNEIHVENKTILIPQMEVKSNVTNIELRGTHHFDQTIDYRVTAPLRNRRKIDPDQAFGAIEQDNAGHAKVFLKILGTTDEYDVSYDKQALKQKLATDMKKEFHEMREAFKKKGKQKKKELELSEEEFDWN